MIRVDRSGAVREARLEDAPAEGSAALIQPNAPSPQLRPAAHVGDLKLLEAMLGGRADPYRGMIEIAHQGGWPIRTGKETIFAFVSNEGPWSVALESNGWRPVEMERKGDLHLLRVEGEPAGRYKLFSPKGEWISDPMSRHFGYDDNGEFSLIRAPAGAHLERWPGLSSGDLLPRTVRVWVPAEKPTHHLYAQDGQNLFHPGGWGLDGRVGSSTLVIGIDSTEHRRDEYTHVPDSNDGNYASGRGDEYADFVRNRMQRFIEERYGQPRKRGLIGSSLGGLISVHIALTYPNNYDFVGCMSGTLGWGGYQDPNSGNRMEDRIRQREKLRRPKFYFDSGGGPQAGDNYDSSRRTADAFADAGYRWNHDLWHWHAPGKKHDEGAWGERVWRPLEIFENM